MVPGQTDILYFMPAGSHFYHTVKEVTITPVVILMLQSADEIIKYNLDINNVAMFDE